MARIKRSVTSMAVSSLSTLEGTIVHGGELLVDTLIAVGFEAKSFRLSQEEKYNLEVITAPFTSAINQLTDCVEDSESLLLDKHVINNTIRTTKIKTSIEEDYTTIENLKSLSKQAVKEYLEKKHPELVPTTDS